eukprot:scaffold41510_cov16-Prasinocladus_malaysianus.AAC.1
MKNVVGLWKIKQVEQIGGQAPAYGQRIINQSVSHEDNIKRLASQQGNHTSRNRTAPSPLIDVTVAHHNTHNNVCVSVWCPVRRGLADGRGKVTPPSSP